MSEQRIVDGTTLTQCIRGSFEVHRVPGRDGGDQQIQTAGAIPLITLKWLRDPALRRRVTGGLNKGEARNALARTVFFHRLGEIRTIAKIGQSEVKALAAKFGCSTAR